MKVKPDEFTEVQGPVLDPDLYPAVLTGFGEHDSQWGPRMVWQFEIEHEGTVYEAAAFTSYSMANGKMKSTLIKWSEILLGELPEEFDTDELIGLPCRVDIENYTKENGITKNKAVAVKPAKKGQKGKAKKEAAPANGKEEVDLNSEDFDDLPF